MLERLRDPDRGFDAVVIGEPQRAFYGNQFGLTFPVFTHFGVALWVPEVSGPIDPESEAHDLIMSVFGGMSKGERNRIKIRVRAAMAAQSQVEGRYLGGRPPYGYRLADAGPHPHPGKAADGKRLRKLEADPVTAPVVRRIFREYLMGFGIFAIAQRLTAEGIACPSAHDYDRNRHRSGVAWSKSAVRTILANPRYTGFAVWNKQRKQESLIDVEDVALGNQTRLIWNERSEWVCSEHQAHEALVSVAEFERANGRRATQNAKSPGRVVTARTRHPYQFKGLLTHKAWGRRMQGNWNHERPHYRCRYPSEYALANDLDHPKSGYVREDQLAAPPGRLAGRGVAPRPAGTLAASTGAGPHRHLARGAGVAYGAGPYREGTGQSPHGPGSRHRSGHRRGMDPRERRPTPSAENRTGRAGEELRRPDLSEQDRDNRINPGVNADPNLSGACRLKSAQPGLVSCCWFGLWRV
ncbi:recombinase family protein, partial [Nocardia takedensis]